MAKLSILIPVYNASNYLTRCLDSVLAQTFTDFEVICINDGSTDRSLSILETYHKRDSRITILNKTKNSGYGDSMNQGIKKARGEYIGIVEPDDFCDPAMFSILINAASARFPDLPIDVVRAGYIRFATSSNYSRIVSNPAIANDQKNVPINLETCPALLRLAPDIWSAIYRREFLLKEHIAFLSTPGASYQDLGFSLKVWLTAKSVIILDDALYHYCVDNSNSSIHSHGKERAVVNEYVDVERFAKTHGVWSKAAPQLAATQFSSYHWNFQRLPAHSAKSFYYFWRDQLKEADANNLLTRQFFGARNLFVARCIIHQPHLAYLILRLRAYVRRRKHIL